MYGLCLQVQKLAVVAESALKRDPLLFVKALIKFLAVLAVEETVSMLWFYLVLGTVRLMLRAGCCASHLLKKGCYSAGRWFVRGWYRVGKVAVSSAI